MKVAILGSTGSIGTNTLEIIARHADKYDVIGLAAGQNVELLIRQVAAFKPCVAALAGTVSPQDLQMLQKNNAGCEILSGDEAMIRVATLPGADTVVAAIAGSPGLLPTLAAVDAGKTVALANKEALVMAGQLIFESVRRNGGSIIPVDSEHSAIYQLLNGSVPRTVRKIILTASGGPFLHCSSEDLKAVTLREALRHPRWKMGAKVTIDSASLMNKALEVIEAHWLFGLPPEKISVVIHPQSIIHSMVEFVDGTVFAHMSQPDMKGPIAYALSCPERLHDMVAPLDMASLGTLTFQEPDTERFPAIGLAYRALKCGGLMPAVMNAANEVAVQKFSDKAISFLSIAKLIAAVMDRFHVDRDVNLENILWADAWARGEAEQLAGDMSPS